MGSKLPEDKRHYSVDEMMDRLKDVRAVKDGRGRKRRRSKQAKVEPNQMFQRTLVKVTIWLAVLLLVVAIVVFAVSKFNEFRYGGAKFSDSVAERLSEMTGMKVGLGKFEVDGRSMGMREALVSGGEGDFLRSARLKGFQGHLEMRSYFGSEWYLDKFDLFEVEVEVGKPGGGAVDPGVGGGGESGDGGGMGLASRPNAVVPEVVRLRDFNVVWEPSGRGAGDFSLEGVDVVAEMFSGEADVHANGGTLVAEGFPVWQVQNIAASWSKGVLDIDQSRFTVDERDELKISGRIDTNQGGGMDLKGTLTRLVLSRFLPDYWGGKMDGFLDSEFTFVMNFAEGGAPELSGSFEIGDFVLRGLPVFDALAIYSAEHGMGFMELASVRGKFRRVGNVVTISDFDSIQAGLLKLRGEITVTNGELGGVVEVGLPDALFDRLGVDWPEIFKVEGNGFAWAAMNLGGTTNAPSEDLTEKLMELTRKRSEARAAEARAAAAAAAAGSAGQVVPVPDRGAAPTDGGGAVVPASEANREKQIEDAFESLINDP